MALPENDTVKITVMEQELLPPLDTHQAIADCFQVLKSRTLMKIRLETGENSSLTTSYMASYPTMSKIRPAFRGVHPILL